MSPAATLVPRPVQTGGGVSSQDLERLTSLEWLEADGLGGYASGTASGIRTRRYHALVMAATRPPTDRMALVNGFDAWWRNGNGAFPLSTQHYASGALSPNGARFIESFSHDPWPQWVLRLPDGTRLRHELFVPKGSPAVVLTWKCLSPGGGVLEVRPFLSGRDDHALQRENRAFRFGDESGPGRTRWRSYEGAPAVEALHNGSYRREPCWYKGFLYEREKARGVDCLEDLGSPGVFRWEPGSGEAVLILRAQIPGEPLDTREGALRAAAALRKREKARREQFPSPLHRAADAYLVRRGRGLSLIAGYPWFTDWGRDTFISLRGICLAGGRMEEARKILLEWSSSVSEGLLPDLFPDKQSPQYNAMDAPLWFIIAVYEFLTIAGKNVSSRERRALLEAVEAIVDGFRKGTRYNIRIDRDGLVAGGSERFALTWMDAYVRGVPVTPRRGKPVEVQVLWINALEAWARLSGRKAEGLEEARRSFDDKFWNAKDRCLYDVVEVEGRPGDMDRSFRPSQILAAGGVPWPPLAGTTRAREVVERVESRLLTPLGLRSMAPGEPAYAARYEGGQDHRDRVYHNGPAWPWLMGPFVAAWLGVHGRSTETLNEAWRRFVEPLLQHLQDAGLGHVSEIADSEPPYIPRGCPFQAWSLGELLRIMSFFPRRFIRS